VQKNGKAYFQSGATTAKRLEHPEVGERYLQSIAEAVGRPSEGSWCAGLAMHDRERQEVARHFGRFAFLHSLDPLRTLTDRLFQTGTIRPGRRRQTRAWWSDLRPSATFGAGEAGL
jgi:hypothetical protein